MILILLAIEVGFRGGEAVKRKTEREKESPVSAITGTVLALLAFMLAFTFGIVSDRYDARKALVREQAITISTAFSRTDFLEQPDDVESKNLFREYTAAIISAAEPEAIENIEEIIVEAKALYDQIWAIGVEYARLNPESEMMGLYIDSLNAVGDVQDIRVAVAVQARIPDGIWLALITLVLLAMIAVGYQTSIANSRRSWILLILALSFSTVITLIALLDNPTSDYLKVSQQPLITLLESMGESTSP